MCLYTKIKNEMERSYYLIRGNVFLSALRQFVIFIVAALLLFACCFIILPVTAGAAFKPGTNEPGS